jgi:hypothetical protein
MEASTAEEKQRLMEEVSRLQREEDANMARLEEEAAGRERLLQETLEANKRMAAEQEKERAEMLQRQQEVVAREVEKKLEEANKAAGRNSNGTVKVNSPQSICEYYVLLWKCVCVCVCVCVLASVPSTPRTYKLCRAIMKALMVY